MILADFDLLRNVIIIAKEFVLPSVQEIDWAGDRGVVEKTTVIHA